MKLYRLKPEQVELIKEAGALLDRMKGKTLEPGSDELRCFYGLSFFLGMRSADEWEHTFNHEEFPYILNAYRFIETLVTLSRMFR